MSNGQSGAGHDVGGGLQACPLDMNDLNMVAVDSDNSDLLDMIYLDSFVAVDRVLVILTPS